MNFELANLTQIASVRAFLRIVSCHEATEKRERERLMYWMGKRGKTEQHG